MLNLRWLLVVTGCIGCATSAAREPGSADPLFASDDILQVRISAPLTTLLDERPLEDEHAATFNYTDADGNAVELDLQIRTRGRFRHREDVCRFPPMRLNFRRSQVENTLLQQQDKLKLVTHCQTSKNYEQVVLREYLAYRVLNVLTDNSFRVRLLRITWSDTEQQFKELTRLGFVIEHKERLAARLEQPLVSVTNTTLAQLDAEHNNLTSVFQFLLGNTDFSPIKGSGEDDCCHNHVLFGDEAAAWLSVPYDFDQSGFVNAPYASPNIRFGLRNVRQRLYRGRCDLLPQLPATLDVFRDHRDALYELVSTADAASGSSTRYLKKYLDSFFRTLDSERRIDTNLVKACI